MNRRSFLEDQSTRLFDARKLIVGVCITAAAYAILEFSRAHGSEVKDTNAAIAFWVNHQTASPPPISSAARTRHANPQ
ncbi:MAG: hypothetical protein GY758_10740 [Fuerstiella sp.]|nr:hypothetical protein [Fuerstiella sp.]MCP4782966.1 hypothetical protein [Fuerstiella sp.]MCP4857855.1 hypothetical protein [Fuerstiella sp.]